jgi:hypothetical protein
MIVPYAACTVLPGAIECSFYYCSLGKHTTVPPLDCCMPPTHLLLLPENQMKRRYVLHDACSACFVLCRKYHILQYEPVVSHPMLHHGVAYSCGPSDVPKVEALPSMGPFDRFKQGMLCEQFFMVGAVMLQLSWHLAVPSATV